MISLDAGGGSTEKSRSGRLAKSLAKKGHPSPALRQATSHERDKELRVAD
jgi:hypothetical protein